MLSYNCGKTQWAQVFLCDHLLACQIQYCSLCKESVQWFTGKVHWIESCKTQREEKYLFINIFLCCFLPLYITVHLKNDEAALWAVIFVWCHPLVMDSGPNLWSRSQAAATPALNYCSLQRDKWSHRGHSAWDVIVCLVAVLECQ